MKKNIKNMKIIVLLLLLLSPMFVNAEEKTYVAQVGETKYENWTDVLTNVKDNDEIVLLSDIHQGDVVFNENIRVVLNLNNYTAYYINHVGSGILTIKGPGVIRKTGVSGCVFNGQNGTLIIDNVTFINDVTLDGNFYMITNNGTAIIKNSTFNDEYKCALFLNNGKLTIESGTYSAYQLFNSSGYLVINNGNFTSSTANISGSARIHGGTFVGNGGNSIFKFNGDINSVEINGGTFTGTNGCGIAELHNSTSILINKGTFNVSDSHVFTYDTSSENSLISFRENAIINSDGDAYVISDKGTNNTINITGGTINSKQAGILDGEGTQLNTPEGYSIQYTKNDDGSYTASLVKDTINDNVGDLDGPSLEYTPEEDCDPEETPEQPKEETVKNPETGLFNSYSILISVIVILGGVGYFVIRKRSKFPQV